MYPTGTVDLIIITAFGLTFITNSITVSIEKEKKYPVKISIEIGKVIISCTNQTGDAKEEIYVSTEGKNLEVGFNPRYFLDALKVIDDEEIFIDFGSSISPSVIRSVDEGDYTYMILPIRLKE